MPADVEVLQFLGELNRCWLEGRPDDLVDYLHHDAVMVYPRFDGGAEGARSIIDGFRDFIEHARIIDYEESDHQITVIGRTGVASYSYRMLYERQSRQYIATGRDLWVLTKVRSGWKAVWRTMLETAEEPLGD